MCCDWRCRIDENTALSRARRFDDVATNTVSAIVKRFPRFLASMERPVAGLPTANSDEAGKASLIGSIE